MLTIKNNKSYMAALEKVVAEGRWATQLFQDFF
jgi:hypothetical protein